MSIDDRLRTGMEPLGGLRATIEIAVVHHPQAHRRVGDGMDWQEHSGVPRGQRVLSGVAADERNITLAEPRKTGGMEAWLSRASDRQTRVTFAPVVTSSEEHSIARA